MKCIFAVEYPQLQLNSLMTSQVAAAMITLLVFNSVKCTFPEAFSLTGFYYFSTDVSTQVANVVSLALEDNARYDVPIFKHCPTRRCVLQARANISLAFSIDSLRGWKTHIYLGASLTSQLQDRSTSVPLLLALIPFVYKAILQTLLQQTCLLFQTLLQLPAAAAAAKSLQ